jgi:hypothetical protein
MEEITPIDETKIKEKEKEDEIINNKFIQTILTQNSQSQNDLIDSNNLKNYENFIKENNIDEFNKSKKIKIKKNLI